MWSLWFSIGGVVILVVSAGLESYWEFGREARPDFRPAICGTAWWYLLLAGWILLGLVGAVLLFMVDPYFGLVAVVVYWLLFPISVGARVRRRVLPPWDDLKNELEKQGYSEGNYWRRGDWWKAEDKRKRTRGPGS